VKTRLLIYLFTLLLIEDGFISLHKSPAQTQANNIDLTTGLPAQKSQPILFKSQTDVPVNAKILWDTTHGVYLQYKPAGFFSALSSKLQDLGYSITTTSNFLNEPLSEYDVFVVCLGSAWDTTYTLCESQQIKSYVQNGGGLLIMGDNPWSPNANIATVSEVFGISSGVSFIGNLHITELDPVHPIFVGINSIYFRSGGELEVVLPAKAVARTSENKVAVAVAEYGFGRIVVTGDVNFCCDNWLDKADNQTFSENIFYWLSTKSKGIVIKAPNGGEIWQVSPPAPIIWHSLSDPADKVKIEFSDDNGDNWQTLTTNTPNDGKWKEPWSRVSLTKSSTKCLLKITSLKDTSHYDVSDTNFAIFTNPAEITYHAKRIPRYLSLPTIDGNIDEPFWEFIEKASLLYGDQWRQSWTDTNNNLVTWRAVWSDSTNKLYVAVSVKDNVAGTLDNNDPSQEPFEPWHDDSIEFYTDGDHKGENYRGHFDSAQQWRVTRENYQVLNNYPAACSTEFYTGDALNTAVINSSNGNWNCEAEFTIYNNYDTEVTTLETGKIIGWEIRYTDSDNESKNNDHYLADHVTGWIYYGDAQANAYSFGDMVLDEALPHIHISFPNGEEELEVNSVSTITWQSAGTSGKVRIELSRDGGKTWEKRPLFNITVDDGSVDWTVDVEPSQNCLMKITDVSNSKLSDVSDAPFAIIIKNDTSLAQTTGNLVLNSNNPDNSNILESTTSSKENLPTKFFLNQNYPNPFNPETNFTFGLPEAQNVAVLIFNIQGQLVTTLMNEFKAPGIYTLSWNAINQSSGIYLCKLQTEQFSQTLKILLAK